MNNSSAHKDFYKIEGLKFDIVKLQEGLNEVLKIIRTDQHDLPVSRFEDIDVEAMELVVSHECKFIR